MNVELTHVELASIIDGLVAGAEKIKDEIGLYSQMNNSLASPKLENLQAHLNFFLTVRKKINEALNTSLQESDEKTLLRSKDSTSEEDELVIDLRFDDSDQSDDSDELFAKINE